ncbi:MAG: PAS domain-containing sensor histidine kinase [Gemmatimonadota bacterium]
MTVPRLPSTPAAGGDPHPAAGQAAASSGPNGEPFRTALAGSNITVATCDTELRYTWVHNPPPWFPDEDVIGRRADELASADAMAELMTLKRDVLRTGERVRREVPIRVGDEQLFYQITGEPLRDAAQEVIGVAIAAADVTAQRRAEETQRFIAETDAILTAPLDVDVRMRLITDVAIRTLADYCILVLTDPPTPQPIISAARDPEKLKVVEALLGSYPAEERRGALLVERVLESGEPLLIEDVDALNLDVLVEDEHQRELIRRLASRSTLAVPLRATDRALGVLVLGIVGPGPRYTEAQLRAAGEMARRAASAIENARLYEAAQQAVTARAQMQRVVAHDLRSPLSVLSSTVQLLAAGGDATVARRADIARRAIQQMERLIDDLLDFSRLESGGLSLHKERFSPAALVHEMVELEREHAAGHDLTLHAEVHDHLPRLHCDPDRLRQVLANLLANAVKFTPAGGEITVRAEPGDGGVRFSVQDSGIGVEPEQVPHIFDPFWQSKRGGRAAGAGLGLAIARGIVEMHGGRIDVASAGPGRGSTFWFTIPVESETGE